MRRHRRPWGLGDRRRERGRLGCYLRARLHRRIFVLLGLSILVTGAVVSSVFALSMGREGSAWHQEMERGRTFLTMRFSQVWDDPPGRAGLAADVSGAMEVSLELLDPRGRPIGRFGDVGRWGPGAGDVLVIERDGQLVGYVRLVGRRPRHAKWPLVLTLLVAGAMLWLASRFLSHRLGRPLIELERVVREIGAGKLDSRVELGRDAAGEVGVVAEAVNEMAARIEKQMSDQRELLAAVSHEMRTPMGHLRVLVELARDAGADPETMDDMEQELVEADRLIDELLASSRLDFDALSRRSLDGNEVLRLAAQRAGLAPEQLQESPEPVTFEGDPTLLARALANLLENARRHGGGVTALRARALAGALRFEVEDGGPGLGDEDRARLFESFRRGEASRESERGAAERRGGASLGLGLSLVSRIARAHGGDVGAEDLPGGGGARFWFEVAR